MEFERVSRNEAAACVVLALEMLKPQHIARLKDLYLSRHPRMMFALTPSRRANKARSSRHRVLLELTRSAVR